MADNTADGQKEEANKDEPARDFSKDQNAQKRLKAGKRSSQRNAGKPIDSEDKPEEPAMSTQNPVQAEQDKNSIEADIKGFEEGGEVPEDKELQPAPAPTTQPQVSGDPDIDAITAQVKGSNYNSNAVKKASGKLASILGFAEGGEVEGEGIVAETPPGMSGENEGGGIVEAAAHEKEEILETPTDEQNESPIEQEQEMAKGQEMHTPTGQDIGEYTSPEGAAHDDLIDAYHDAIMYGNMEEAKQLYRQLQNHRFAENAHRTKIDGKAVQDENDYLAAAEELAAAHPELGEDGLPAQKVLAIADIYRNNGSSPADALRQAVADLYPDAAKAPMAEPPMGAPPEEVMEPAPEAAAPEAAAPEAAAPEAPVPTEVEVPDMEDRNVKKREIPSTPASASAKEMPPEPPKAPNRSDAITEMKRKRGQA